MPNNNASDRVTVQYYFRGMAAKEKSFKNQAAFERWLEKLVEREGGAPEIRMVMPQS